MNKSPVVRGMLKPLSWLYGTAVRIRVWMYEKGWLKQHQLKAAVISVGNLTVGGTGKTPMVIWLAEKFLAKGKRVAILSRGYKGSNGTSDEVELLKFRLQNRVILGVGKNRLAEGQRLESQQAIDVFLLDDGFQHLKLRRDLDILLMDASTPLYEESLLPAGRLREPLSAMSRANLVVFTRVETTPGAREAIERLSKVPVFAATTHLVGFRRLGNGTGVQSPDQIGSGPFFAFCGLGNPEAFFRDLENWALPICGRAIFADHHRYSVRDVASIQQTAKQAGANALVTTEKDEQNLAGLPFGDRPVYISVIDITVSPEADFRNLLDQTLAGRTTVAA